MIKKILLWIALFFFAAFPFPLILSEMLIFVLLCLLTWLKVGIYFMYFLLFA